MPPPRADASAVESVESIDTWWEPIRSRLGRIHVGETTAVLTVAARASSLTQWQP